KGSVAVRAMTGVGRTDSERGGGVGEGFSSEERAAEFSDSWQADEVNSAQRPVRRMTSEQTARNPRFTWRMVAGPRGRAITRSLDRRGGP
ncbi:MAG: hypothetical protein VCA34_07750, partial [Roseibacillus sp.]